MPTVEDRFWAKVDKTGECWTWTAATFTARMGYGKFQAGTSRATSRVVRAHRFAWELEHGPIPEGMDLLHACDNPPCVRVDHLRLGTRRENNEDMACKLRHGNSKLTPELVREIRDSDEPSRVIGRRLGLAKTTVLDVRRRAIWRHVT